MVSHKPEKGREKRMPTRRPQRLSKDDLERMVEDATVDACGESEQVTGFYTMLENDLELPFKTVVLGAEVTVERLDLTDDDRIVLVCQRGQKRQRLSILDLPLPDPPPNGRFCMKQQRSNYSEHHCRTQRQGRIDWCRDP